MEKKKVFVTRRIDEKGLDILRNHSSIELDINDDNKLLTKEDLIRRAKGAEGLVTLLNDKIDKDVIEKLLPELKIISNYAVGFDNIDCQFAKEKGIVVTNTPDIMTQAVAEHAMALMLSCARRIVEGDRYVRAGKYDLWEPDLLLGPEIAGKTLGIIGIGRIGQALAQIAYHGFGMKILYNDINDCEEVERNFQADKVSLEHLLSHSDFVSIHVPLLDETRHMIGSEQFKNMKKNSILVNTARGAIVDEAAMLTALKEKEIFAAGVDVYEKEGEVNPELYKLDNIVLTPHIASATNEAREAMSECVAENILAVLSNKPAINEVK